MERRIEMHTTTKQQQQQTKPRDQENTGDKNID